MIILIKNEELNIITELESKYGSLTNVPEDDQYLLKLRSLTSREEHSNKIKAKAKANADDQLRKRIRSLPENKSIKLLYKDLNRSALMNNKPIRFSLSLPDYKSTTENLFRRGYSKKVVLYQMTSKVGTDFINEVYKRFNEGLKNGTEKYVCIPDDIVQLNYNIKKSKFKTVKYYSSSMSREMEWVRISVKILQKYLDDELYSNILLNSY